MSSLLSSHPITLLLLAQQRIERYLRLQEVGIRECSWEDPLVEEEIALLEEEVLPVIFQFLERADAIAADREAWAEQQVRAEEFVLEPSSNRTTERAPILVHWPYNDRTTILPALGQHDRQDQDSAH